MQEELKMLRANEENHQLDIELWKFKYMNQELIKKHSSQESDFRKTYLETMGSRNDGQMMGRLTFRLSKKSRLQTVSGRSNRISAADGSLQ